MIIQNNHHQEPGLFLEEVRLETFNKFPWPHPDKSLCSGQNMAEAGFFYAGHSDAVKCFVCQITLKAWDADTDEPMTKHRENSPNCMFASFAKPESKMTVDEWLEVMCAKAINSLDKKFAQLAKQTAAAAAAENGDQW